MAVILSVIGKYDGKELERAQKQLAAMQKEAATMANKFGAMGSKLQSVGKNIGKVGGSLTKGVTLPIIAGGAALLAFAKGAEDAEIANRKLGSVLDSMGYPQATKRVSDYAESLERSLAVDADVIKATQTKLATFKNLTASVNESGGAFDRATMAALDLAAAGFGSAETNAVQLGKALQDPIKGITALGRAGVTFTDQEKEKIKALVESGNLLDAQNMVLKAIEGQVGGTAEAGASSFDKIKLSLMQVADAIGMAVLPLINQLSDFIANTLVPTVVPMIDRIVQSFTNLDPVVKKAMLVFVGLAAAAGPLLMIVGKVVSVAGVLTTALGAITVAGSLLFIKVIAVVAVLAAIALAFKFAYDNSEPLRKAVDTLVTTFKNVFAIVKNSVLGAFDSMNGAVGKSNTAFTLIGNYLKAFFTGYVTFLTGAIKVLGGAFQVAMKVFEIGFTVLQMGAGIIRGVLLAAFDILMNKLGPISTAFSAVANGVKSAFGAIAGFIRSAFSNVGKVVETFINFAIDAVNVLIKAFNFLAKFLPGVSEATEIAEFKFNQMSGAADQAASSANNLANQVGGYAGQVMRGNQAVDAAFNTNTKAAKSFDGVATAASGAGSAAEKAGNKAKEAAKKFNENFVAVRDHLTGIVDDIKTKMADMATSVSSSLMSGFQLGDAAEEFGEDGARIGGTFMEKLQEQANKVTNFAAKIKELMALGLGINSPLMQAVIAEGAGSGTAIAQSLIDSGAAGIDQATGMVTAAQGAADEIGTLAAGSFYQAGLDSAQQTLQAFIDRFGVDGKARNRLMGLMDNLANAMRRETTITVTTVNRSINADKVEGRAMGGPVAANTTYLVGEQGPELLTMGRTPGNIIPNNALSMTGGGGGGRVAGGAGSVINLTVNAGMGTQGAEVGRQIVDALKAYERRNGSVYVAA
jgi:phage-related protein